MSRLAYSTANLSFCNSEVWKSKMVLPGLPSRCRRGHAPSGDSGSICSLPPARLQAPARLAPSSKPLTPVWSSPRIALASLTSLPLLRMLWVRWSHLDHPQLPTSLPSGQLTYDLSSIYFLRTSLGVIILPTTGNVVKNQTKSVHVTISSSLSFYSTSETPSTSVIHLLVHSQPLNCETRDWIYLSL